VDPASGRPYYFNQTTGQSAWDPPLVANPVAAAATAAVTPTHAAIPQSQPYNQPVTAAIAQGGVPGMYGGQMATVQPQQQQQQMSSFKPMSTIGSVGNFSAAPITSTGFNPTNSSVGNPQHTAAPILPAPAPAPAIVKDPLPDTEGIILLNQVITAVTAVASPAEKRQMAMVNEAFSLLRKRASEGAVASDILQKVHQFANDISIRNFPSASAIQAVSEPYYFLFLVFYLISLTITSFLNICFFFFFFLL
jgi:hypothetical protein